MPDYRISLVFSKEDITIFPACLAPISGVFVSGLCDEKEYFA